MKALPPGACLAILTLGLSGGCSEAEPPLPASLRTPPSPPAPVERPLPLTPGAVLEREIAGGEAHLYRFDLPAGRFADLVVEQWGIDLVVRALPPQAPPLPAVDSPNGTLGPEPLPVLAGTAGTYRIEVRSPDSGAAAGEYALRVRATRPATSRDRDRVAAERAFAEGEELRRRRGGGSFRAAVAKDREAAALFHRAGEEGRKADVLYALGRLHSDLGEPEEALRAFGEALPVFRREKERRKTGRTLNSLGPLHLARGDPDAALLCYREALEALRALGDRQGEATALHNFGRAYTSLGRIEEALAHYDAALALWRDLKLPGEEGKTLANRSRLYLYFSLDGAEKARDELRRALALLEAAGLETDASSVLIDLAVAEARAGRPREGLSLLDRALELQRRLGDSRHTAVTLANLGWLHVLLGDLEEGRRLYEQALALFYRSGDRANQAAALASLGHIHLARGGAAAAAPAYGRALPLFRAVGDRAGEATALLGLARLHRLRGDLQGARERSEEALSRIESLRTEPESPDLRASFFASQQDVYAFHVDLLVELHRREPAAGHEGQALETSERAKARSLLDLLTGTGSRLRPGLDPALAAREATLFVEPLSLAEIRQRVLDDETVLLEYSLGETRSFLWAVTPDRVMAFALPPRAVIEKAARRAHSLLADSRRTLARGQAERALEQLSRLLLAPVAGRLAARRLLIVPDGALHLVPFGALPEPSSLREPLLARHEVAVLPSASSLALIRQRSATRRSPPGVVAVLADPVFRDPGPFVRLPFSRAEARDLLALAPPGERLSALGTDASREVAKSGALGRFRILHFATHAILDPDRPERSGIALSTVDAQGQPRDGLLSAREIYLLRLPADLVVLSACETALGREVRGEGLVGLTQAFFHAGAQRVVVSLWPVDDEATAALMRRFYRGLFADGLPPAAALRQAQDSLRHERRWSSPSYWAGFVLQGEWR